jgi:hypothetical protein
MINYVMTRLEEDSNLPPSFPLIALQGAQMPAIVVQLVSTEPIDTHDKLSTIDEHTVEVTILEENPKDAWTASGRVRTKLDGWSDSSAQIITSRFENQATDVFESTDIFSVSQRYLITMNR